MNEQGTEQEPGPWDIGTYKGTQQSARQESLQCYLGVLGYDEE